MSLDGTPPSPASNAWKCAPCWRTLRRGPSARLRTGAGAEDKSCRQATEQVIRNSQFARGAGSPHRRPAHRGGVAGRAGGECGTGAESGREWEI